MNSAQAKAVEEERRAQGHPVDVRPDAHPESGHCRREAMEASERDSSAKESSGETADPKGGTRTSTAGAAGGVALPYPASPGAVPADSSSTPGTDEATQSPLLAASGLCKTFRSRSLLRKGSGIKALDNVTLNIMPGDTVGLVGESGSGKTTLGKALVKLHKLDSGRVHFKGRNLDEMGMGELKEFRHHCQMLFQNPSSTLHPKMPVGKLIKESLRLHRGLREPGELDAAVRSLLEKVSLSGRETAYPDELSGGQKRRVGIARILAAQPELLVADEPTSGLDALLRAEIIDLLLKVKEPHVSYLIISHDLNVVQRACELVVVMFHGRIVEILPRDSFDEDWHHPYTIELFNAAARLRGDVGRVHKATHREVVRSPQERGCAYLERCAVATANPDLARDHCSRIQPELKTVNGKHQIACHGQEELVRAACADWSNTKKECAAAP